MATAVTLVAPAGADLVHTLHRETGLPPRTTATLLAAGGVLSVPAIVASLAISRRLLPCGF